MIVKKLRLQRGWSQEQLAEFTGLSARTIQRIERGQTPGLETAKALGAVFEVDHSTFLEEDTTMEAAPDRPAVTLDERLAMNYVKGLKDFYTHLLIYCVMSVVFGLLFDLPPFFTFCWVGWTVGVIVNGLMAYEVIHIFTPGWEKRVIEKRLGRKL